MLAALQFFELRSSYTDRELNTPFSVTVQTLADIWHCTPRNVKMVLRKLSDLGWISWQPGLGRGNASMLAFLADAQDILLEESIALTKKGDVKGALELIDRFGESTQVKNGFLEWLSGGMGFTRTLVTDMVLDTLRFPVQRFIVTLDPASIYYAFDAHIIGHIYDTLVDFDPVSETFRPAIAHFWESSPDCSEWIIHLRKGVSFHHGREVTAQDVIYTFDRLRLNPDRCEQSWMFTGISDIRMLDRKTVHITLTESNYLFLQLLSVKASSILPADLCGADEAAFMSHPVGTGAFKLLRYDESICILEAFSSHFRGRPHIDRVEIIHLSEQDAGMLKEPDWSRASCTEQNIYNGYLRKSAGPDAEWREVETISPGCSMLVFNQRKEGPQNSPAFRQALDLIIDRSRMIADLGENRIFPAQGFRTERGRAADQAEGVEPAPDAAEIYRLLEQSGYRGETVRLSTHSRHAADAQWIRQRCRAFGIRMEIQMRKAEDMANPAFSPEHDCQLYEIVLGNDEIQDLELYLQQGFFPSALADGMLDTVTASARAVMSDPDPQSRWRRLNELEELLRQSYSVLFLLHKKSNTRFHSSIQGINLNSCGWVDFRTVWFQPHSLA
ncbi:MarR-like DNA-binding transcriptional regulator SgrR of sgrS sRNA [Paenibacillus forsythiae]|uniref:MarR-like DNA-binding transcriptional regulator SgrR of sgrS sRNA n=1 Tax=Paenibacillus forsythiae TaxID=365616 RepID=A0ABU3H928_9BACL|nr:ABC transporter substrate-binding protein [Paenibacillus forsythiae]MDT3427333.1 MarR-like DNA-binding transcriptional regulator SgrR of sgrS sRNA [Paenibacillus forsythiae]